MALTPSLGNGASLPRWFLPFKPIPSATNQATCQVNVPTSGTPVPLATAQTPCCRIFIEVIAGGTGNMFLGVPGLNQATGVNVIAALAPYTNTPGVTQGQWAAWCAAGDWLDLSQYVIDAAVSGEGLNVTYWPC